jgi:signal transduction histidine kinase
MGGLKLSRSHAQTDPGSSSPLTWPDQDGLRAAFRDETLMLCHRSLRALCAIGFWIIPVFAPFDYMRYPQEFTSLLWVRIATAWCFGGIFLILRTRWGREHPQLLALLCTANAGGMLCGMMMLTGGYSSHYYTGFTLLLLTVPMVMTWSALWTALNCVLMITGYAAISPWLLGNSAAPQLADQLSTLVGTGGLAVVITGLRERLRWREFGTRWTIAQAYHHKSAFFATMSHELRTPIHIMIGYVDMLLEEGKITLTDARQLLERVRTEGMQLHHLVSDLLDFAKVEAGKMDVTLEPVRVAELLAEAESSFKLIAEQKHLSFESNCRDDVSIVSDRQKLHQVLNNLVSNAIKFTETGGIAVDVRAFNFASGNAWDDLVFLDGVNTHVRRAGRTFTSGVAISITDSGIGIRADDLEKLAIDFQQVNSERPTTDHRGTGLGLSLSRKLLALIGGRMAVRSRYGEGTTFVVLLPERPAQA